MGVTVTFMAILELVREGLLDLVQAEAYGPLHVRSAGPNRALHLVASNDPVEAEEPLYAPELQAGAAPASEVAAVDAASGARLEFDDLRDDELDDDLDDDLGGLEGVDDVVDDVADDVAVASAEPMPEPETKRKTAPEPDLSEEP
jgi:segregation and condensation protein A